MNLDETYKRDGNCNYLIIRGKKEKYQDYSDRILQENRINGLLTCQYRFIDGEVYFYYKMNSLQSLAQVFEKRKAGGRELEDIMLSMKKNWDEVDSFLLPRKKILLHPEYIFTDFNLKQVYFCYYPDYEGEGSYEELASFFVECVDYNEKEAVELAYGFHRLMCQENSSFSDAYAELLNNREEIPQISISENTMTNNVSITETTVETEKEQTYGEKIKNLTRWRNPLYVVIGIVFLEAVLFFGFRVLEFYKGIIIMFISVLVIAYILWSRKNNEVNDEDEYEIRLDGDIPKNYQGETLDYQGEIFTEEVERTMFLPREDTLEKHRLIYRGIGKQKSFELDVFPFVLGKADKGIDGKLEGAMVSRIHCRINYVNQEYTIQDLNSTNGTYLNGTLLAPRQECKLHSGDSIILADEAFLFQ